MRRRLSCAAASEFLKNFFVCKQSPNPSVSQYLTLVVLALVWVSMGLFVCLFEVVCMGDICVLSLLLWKFLGL